MCSTQENAWHHDFINLDIFFEVKKILFDDDSHFSLVLPRRKGAKIGQSPDSWASQITPVFFFLHAVLAIGELEGAASMALVLKETEKTYRWEMAMRQSWGTTARIGKFYSFRKKIYIFWESHIYQMLWYVLGIKGGIIFKRGCGDGDWEQTLKQTAAKLLLHVLFYPFLRPTTQCWLFVVVYL